MSFTPMPVIANDKNKPECIFSNTERFFYVETATKGNKNDSTFKSGDFNEIICW